MYKATSSLALQVFRNTQVYSSLYLATHMHIDFHWQLIFIVQLELPAKFLYLCSVHVGRMCDDLTDIWDACAFLFFTCRYSSQPSGRLRVRYLETGEVESIVEEMMSVNFSSIHIDDQCMSIYRKSGHCDCEQETIVKWIRGSSIVSSITCSQESGTLIAALDLKGYTL